MEHIVKRLGHQEKFDVKKVYGSSYAACLNCHMKKKECEGIADKVCNGLKKWIRVKKRVTSDQIFKQVIRELKKHNKDAAFMFETHRDIS